MSAPARRSSRQRKVNSKYAHGGWDKETLRLLRESSESSNPTSSDTSEQIESDQAFDAPPSGPEEDLGEPDDVSESSWNDHAQSSAVKTPEESGEEDEAELAARDGSVAGDLESRRKRGHGTSRTAHSRGVRHIHGRASKDTIYSRTFGPELDDLFDILRARDTWLRGRDVTFPSRSTLSDAVKLEKDAPRRESSMLARDLGFRIPGIANCQILEMISEDEVISRYMSRENPPHPIVLGPWKRQQRYELDYAQPLDFGLAWPQGANHQANAEPDRPGRETAAHGRDHEGWLLNIGEKIQCLAWAPSPGPTQYLAIATRCPSQRRRRAPGPPPGPPAFHASPPYPAHIQIWAMESTSTPFTGIQSLEMNSSPKRVLVYGTDWGSIQQLEWSPSPPSEEAVGRRNWGLLGVLSSDGHVRVIHVDLPENHDGRQMKAFQVKSAGRTVAPPPGTIFTTLSFPSPTDLLLGAADGSMRLYDLHETSVHDGATPYMIQQLHNTYLLSIRPAYPCTVPTFIASTSASGDLLLTDLRSPDQDRVHLHRGRLPTRNLVYSPFTRSFLTTVDSVANTELKTGSSTHVVCHHLRHFYSGLRVAKLPDSGGSATALAASNLHPCILVGNAQGSVFATNFLRKVLPTRRAELHSAPGAWLQKLCEYEWRPLADDENAHVDLYHGRDVRRGMSRFQEGFMPVKIDLSSRTPKRPSKTNPNGEIGSANVIFEEEQAVVALSWNPNSRCAGWAAIGWGSGIVRVQDLAHDAV